LTSGGHHLASESVPLSVATPLCPYSNAYRRAYRFFFIWTVPFSLDSRALNGMEAYLDADVDHDGRGDLISEHNIIC
jgi:hypothetical protein